MKLPPDFRAKRSLGQNFLVDDNIARKLVQLIAAKPEDIFVEIGPGFGALTKYIVPAGCDYTGIEIDERLLSFLREAFATFPNCRFYHEDFRRTDLTQLAAQRWQALQRGAGRGQPAQEAASRSLRVIGNIPYHLTSVIIFAAHAHRAVIADMTLTVQKEVAQRITAAPGSKDYGILGVISQTFARTEILFTVSRHVFRPKPEVDSAVVRWQFQPSPLPLRDEDFYVRLVKAIFGQRRKTLRRSIAAFLGTNDATASVAPLGSLATRRPETLSVAELIELSNVLLEDR